MAAAHLLPHLLILLLLVCLTSCPYHCGGVGSGMGDGRGGGTDSGRQQPSSKWRGAPASTANADCNEMDEDGEGPKIKNRKININCYILCHRCLQLCRVSILALMPLVCPGWLSCCLLSSTALLLKEGKIKVVLFTVRYLQ